MEAGEVPPRQQRPADAGHSRHHRLDRRYDCQGKAMMLDSTAAADAMSFMTTATSIKVTWNRTTQGGIGYDEVEAIDVAANVYEVSVICNGSGTLATPFSA
jgi:hypothetical protein